MRAFWHGAAGTLKLWSPEVFQAVLSSFCKAVGKVTAPVAVAGSQKPLLGKSAKITVEGAAIRSESKAVPDVVRF